MGLIKNILSYTRRGSKDARMYRLLRAKFDAALDGKDNRRHWLNADGASADAEASAEARAILRNRARYEIANNSYAKGIAQTLANYTIGTGPRLQLLTGNATLDREIESSFMEWAAQVDLAEKLRTMRLTRVSGGEAFIYFYENPGLLHPVTTDLRIIEADMVAAENFACENRSVDGVYLDSHGNPTAYRVLRQHPGDDEIEFSTKAHRVPAADMAHYFRAHRPGQHRGIPDITPALPLFAMLRRFTLAVIAAAESAANFAGILYTDAPAAGEADEVDPLDLVELERNMLLTAPAGWKLGQLKAEQPTTTYPTFTEKILNEIARSVGVPYGIAVGNSSGFNYASGRLDYQSFFKLISIEQSFIANRVLSPLLRHWLNSFEFANRVRLPELSNTGLLPHQWFWDGVEHVDPAKEATAQKTRLANNTTTLAIEYARQGKDWEEQLRQRAKEKSLMKELGLLEDGQKESKGENVLQ